jgi:hypothetical protein
MTNLTKMSEAGKLGCNVSFHRDDDAMLSFRLTQEECRQAAGTPGLIRTLSDLLQFWERPGENSIETFERVAEWFYRETGYLRPGKDCVLHDSEFREQVWKKWRAEKLSAARAAIVSAS